MIKLNQNEYLDYYGYYISLNSTDDFILNLENQLESTSLFFKSLPIDKLEYQYEVGKWTPKDILQHIIDTERIFAYRALRFARFDLTNLPGYEENDYANSANATNRTIGDLIEEYKVVRLASIHLFKSFSEKMLLNIGLANNAPASVRALGFIIAGHEIHHVTIIKERYLK
ncbi:DinB family protein [Flavobacterium difficile]|uniref:DinB family protein n=1 Tax=Flavobacterium difficile TaxID=2709659 RepID=A0ABX0I784_9FLAO|nr:DinB family protein [Flavobacterium difficile]NHM02000.1 DinB family protein [Flavobacterium difficile]